MRDEIIGIARYDRIDATTAEVAFNISDAYQGRGVGSVLLEHLAAIAQEEGVRRFVADVLPQNRKMISVFTEAGYEVSHHYDDGVIAVSFTITPTEQSQAVVLAREHRAESVSMRGVLFPSARSRWSAPAGEPDSIGHLMLQNILAGGFTGSVFAVNPEAREVLGLQSHARVGDIAAPVDLAVIAVPAESVLDVVARLRGRRASRACWWSRPGSPRPGRRGRSASASCCAPPGRNGMRVIGPNSFGIINSHPDVRLNASLAPALPPAGRFGLFAQSGALGVAVLASAARRNLGVSVFASAGNRVDVSGNDFMQYWIDDEDTTAVGLYLESMGNPRKFSRIARHLASIKPVIVVKSGVSSYGVPPGHRARATRVPPGAFDAMLRQAGVIRVENVHQLFDVAQLVVHQPLPRGNRVAIVGNSSALGALTAEACISWDLEVTHGPVSVSAEASAAESAVAIEAAFADERVDSVLDLLHPAPGHARRGGRRGRGRGLGRVRQAVCRDVSRHAWRHRGTVRQGRRRARRASGRARLLHARGRRARAGRRDPVRRVAGA